MLMPSSQARRPIFPTSQPPANVDMPISHPSRVPSPIRRRSRRSTGRSESSRNSESGYLPNPRDGSNRQRRSAGLKATIRRPTPHSSGRAFRSPAALPMRRLILAIRPISGPRRRPKPIASIGHSSEIRSDFSSFRLWPTTGGSRSAAGGEKGETENRSVVSPAPPVRKPSLILGGRIRSQDNLARPWPDSTVARLAEAGRIGDATLANASKWRTATLLVRGREASPSSRTD